MVRNKCFFFFFFRISSHRGRSKKDKEKDAAPAASSNGQATAASSPPQSKKSNRPSLADANDSNGAAHSSGGDRANPFLNAAESSMFRHLPNLKIKPLVSATPTAQLKGPTESSLTFSHGDLASACSVSTYPHIPVMI